MLWPWKLARSGLRLPLEFESVDLCRQCTPIDMESFSFTYEAFYLRGVCIESLSGKRVK